MLTIDSSIFCVSSLGKKRLSSLSFFDLVRNRGKVQFGKEEITDDVDE